MIFFIESAQRSLLTHIDSLTDSLTHSVTPITHYPLSLQYICYEYVLYIV